MPRENQSLRVRACMLSERDRATLRSESLVGQRVIISGLQTKPELNGSHGQCLSFDDTGGRYGVRVAGVGTFALKPEALRDARDAAEDDVVKLVSSMGLSGREENTAFNPPRFATLEEARLQLRSARKHGLPMYNMSVTSFGLVGPGMPIPDGVPANFRLKQVATNAILQEGPASRDGGLGNFRGERAYRLYLEDLENNHAEWMAVFDHYENYEHAEHTCGILGTLATLYRQRGELGDCERVLDMEHEVLVRYQRSSVGASHAQRSCCDGLAYKYRTIRYNLCHQTQRYNQCVELFREQALYEAKNDFDFDSSNYHFMLTPVLGKPSTLREIKRLTDTEVMRMVMAPLDDKFAAAYANEMDQQRRRVELKTCAACGRQEDAVRAFKACARCNAVFYCGRECQKADWKAHKKACKAASNDRVD